MFARDRRVVRGGEPRRHVDVFAPAESAALGFGVERVVLGARQGRGRSGRAPVGDVLEPDEFDGVVGVGDHRVRTRLRLDLTGDVHLVERPVEPDAGVPLHEGAGLVEHGLRVRAPG